jgi:hypothetical protein
MQQMRQKILGYVAIVAQKIFGTAKELFGVM